MAFFDPMACVIDVIFRQTHMRYRYFGVSRETWAAFLSAPSKGTYLNKVLKAAHKQEKVRTGDGFEPEQPWR